MQTANKSPLNPILVVDDELPIVDGYRIALKRAGLNNVISVTDSREAFAVASKQVIDVALVDLNMPHISGEELIDEIVKWQPGVPIIVVTGKNDISSAVNCMRKGAHDYIAKPVPEERVVASVRNAITLRELQRENELLSHSIFSDTLRNPSAFSSIVTNDAVMRAIFLYIEAIATTSYPVLITGETGTGKELIARALHVSSGKGGKFVAVNVAGFDDTLFADTLFGHVKGAFTGADTERAGIISQAAGGTLFLDEIGDLSLTQQVKLLRLLQEQEYTQLGSDIPIKTDARVVVATNADLGALLEAKRFRSDLFYRLNTHKIDVPPLRNRLNDLRLLLVSFISAAASKLNKPVPTAPAQLIALLAEYSFPGNIRELESMVTDAVSQHKSHMLSLKVFKNHISKRDKTDKIQLDEELPSFRKVKKILAEEAVRRTGGNYTRAAELLGTSRQALMWHLKKAKPVE